MPSSESDEKSEDEPQTKYKFGSTQVNLPEGSPAQEAILAMQDNIPDADLAGDGKDIDQPHVTVRYGLRTELTPKIREFIESLHPFEAKLGKTTSFPPSENSKGASPIIVTVVSPELHKLNAEIEKHGDFEPSSFPEYRPHVSVAYVKPEVAEKYTGMDDAEGKTFSINSIAVSDKNGEHTEIALKGESPSVEQDVPTSLDVNTNDKERADNIPEQVETVSTGTDRTTVVPIQSGTQLASAPLQEPVVPIAHKPEAKVLPLSQVQQLAAGLNPERTIKSVRELMAEASKRNPTAIIP